MDRISQLPTLRIDPGREVGLTYCGRRFQGYEGDTVATALYAGGVRVFGRSLKYHRPRGLYSLDGECCNTFMDVDGVPNVSAEKAALREGMVVRAQNVIGSPERDLLGILDKFGWAMPAGFYYHRMHKPRVLWPYFRMFLRKMAGLGRLSETFEIGGRYDEIYPRADVCVVGAGPAGMSAAAAAAGLGLRVIVLEARSCPGGFFDYRSSRYGPGGRLYERAAVLAGELSDSPGVRLLTRATMVGAYNNNLITAYQEGGPRDCFDGRYVEIRAASVVFATGCTERPLIFEHNDRPGVMQVGCAHRLARTWGVLPGRQAVFSVGDDLGLEAAADLSDLGMTVVAVADCRSEGQDGGLVQELKARGIEFLPGCVATCAHGTTGVTGVTLRTVTGSRPRRLDCDVVVASAGLTQASGALFMVCSTMDYDARSGWYVPRDLPAGVHAAGRALGYQAPLSVEASGRLAGLSAAADCGAVSHEVVEKALAELASLPPAVRCPGLVRAPGNGARSFVCFDEDTTVKHVRQACDAGFDRAELAKRYTAAGTGPGQGGIPGHNLPLVISEYTGGVAGSRPTTVRAPLVPTLVATYAGVNHDMYKRTAVHEFQVKAGAVVRRVGVWERARYFSQDFTCRKEIENVRSNVGVIDVATLGKFRLFGPDAEKALQRIYVSDMSRVLAGKAKYSAMCNDDGCLVDDGLIVKVADNDYYVTTTTARAGVTAEWFRYHTRYDGWDFHILNMTDALGAVNLAGPNSRVVLENLTDTDVSNKALPFMGYRELAVGDGIPARVFRLGFVGELSYELHVPTSYLRALWDLVMEAGKPWGIMPFGLEAQNCLRLEKGHVIIGQESEIRTTLHDLGLGFLWYRDKTAAKTVGAVALKQTEHHAGRLKLTALRMDDPGRCPKDGSVVLDGSAVMGHVCTARYSFSLKEAVGLGLLKVHLTAPGTKVQIFEPGRDERISATVVTAPFYDPEGKRLRM